METEKLKFKIELYATYWDQKPACNILINNESKWSGEIDGSESKPNTIEFIHDCKEKEEYKLILNMHSKNDKQTVVEDGKIVKDMMLHIKAIEIDEIDIGALIYEGVYKPEYAEPWATEQKKKGKELPKTLKNVTQMGHNGTWAFTFTSPFYMWLLENLY